MKIVQSISCFIKPLMTLGVLALAIISIPTAIAADVPEYRLQVSPSQAGLGNLEPGETYTGSFSIQNTGTKELPYVINISPYSVSGINYDPVFDQKSGYTEIVDWITISPTSGIVEPNSSEDITYTVEVPKDAPGGNQNAALAISLDKSKIEDDSTIQMGQRIGFLLYANIMGQTRQEAEITSNKIPSLLFASPITVSSTIKNTGNVYSKAEYVLEVKSFFGGEVVYTNADDPDTKIIFPETERYNEVSWDGAPQLGIFKVKQTIKIFDEVSEVEKVVFLCPLWFLFIIILIVGVAVFWIVNRVMKRKQ